MLFLLGLGGFLPFLANSVIKGGESMKPLSNDDFAEIREVTSDQLGAAVDFLDILFSDDLSAFWDSLADIDKSRAQGVFLANEHFNANAEFGLFLEELRSSVRSRYTKVRVDPGFSTSARYTEYGEVYIYAFENVKTAFVVEEETQMMISPIILSPNIRYENGEYSINYKISIYDIDFRSLSVN